MPRLHPTGTVETKYRRRNAIIDFTGVPTIYTRPLVTVHIEVDKILLTSKVFELETLGDTVDICEVLRGIFGRLDQGQEHLVLLTLDHSTSIRGFKVIASGTLHRVEIDEAIVYRNALLLGASSIVLAHNHPADDVVPSANDAEATAKLARIGHDLRIPLLDHIIWTEEKCLSLYAAYPQLFKPPFEIPTR